MAFESFAKALHEEPSMRKRKIIMAWVITQIFQAISSQTQEAITFYIVSF